MPSATTCIPKVRARLRVAGTTPASSMLRPRRLTNARSTLRIWISSRLR
jgi:hypothetical protein